MKRFAKYAACSLIVLAMGAASLQAETILQWGFDNTSGTLASSLPVADDSGAGHPGTNVLWDAAGGTYSADIPNAANRPHTTGIGSLNLSGTTAALATANSGGVATGQGIVTAAQIVAAGGLTSEVWIKNASTTATYGYALLLNASGSIGLGVKNNGKIGYINGDNSQILVDQGTSEWTHLAVVLSGPNAAATTFGTITAYVNGESIGSLTNQTYTWLNRATSVGNHQYANWANYEGLVYEPRVSLGALTPSQFEYSAVPEPGTITMLAMGLIGLLTYAWRKQK